jgi:hypothetical protein
MEFACGEIVICATERSSKNPDVCAWSSAY